jgi:hypothetical protein
LNRDGRHCIEQMHMKPIYHLCVITNYNQHKKISIREQIIIFLQIIGQNPRFHFISGLYYMYVETMHCYFRIVLKTILKLYKHLIKDLEDMVSAKIINNQRLNPYFKVRTRTIQIFL